MAARDNLVYNFVQKSGPRKGQRFGVRRGVSGATERIYKSGDTATIRPQTINPAKVGGVAVPLGQGINRQASNPDIGGRYGAYWAKRREYHVYGSGADRKVKSFKRKTATPEQRAALVNRFKGAVS